MGLTHASAEWVDRNLGATAATWEGHGGGVDSIGHIMYQYGRPAPFAAKLGSPMDTVRSVQNFAYAIKNPVTFIGAGYSNWSNQDTSTSYMWNDKNIAKDTDGKSIFDPSPIGWAIPVYYAYSDFPGNTTTFTDNLATYTPASAVFAPTGYRMSTTSAINGLGQYEHVWTSSPISTANGTFLNITTAAAATKSSHRAQAFSLRPIREN